MMKNKLQVERKYLQTTYPKMKPCLECIRTLKIKQLKHSTRKWAKDMKRYFNKEDIQMTST